MGFEDRQAVARQPRPRSHAAAARAAEETQGAALIPNRDIRLRRQRAAVVRTAPTLDGLRFGFAKAFPNNPAVSRGFGDDSRSGHGFSRVAD